MQANTVGSVALKFSVFCMKSHILVSPLSYMYCTDKLRFRTEHGKSTVKLKVARPNLQLHAQV